MATATASGKAVKVGLKTMKINEIIEKKFLEDNVIDMLEVAEYELSLMLEERPEILETFTGWEEIKPVLSGIQGSSPQVGQKYSVMNVLIMLPAGFMVLTGSRTPLQLISMDRNHGYVQYVFSDGDKKIKYPEDHRTGDQLSRTYLYQDVSDLEQSLTYLSIALNDWTIRDKIVENFADGKVKGKSRPGRVKRAGVNCSASISSLRKTAKNSSGEKQKMAHWCANMKSGKRKK